MDPFSIGVGCLALLGAVKEVTAHLSAFTKAFHEARPEMLAVSRHVQELENILQLLEHDSSSSSSSSSSSTCSRLQASLEIIQTLINNCFDVVEELNRFIQGFQTSTRYGRLAWSTSGKAAVERMDKALQTRIDHLKLALDIQSNTVTLDIKKDTAAILDSQSVLQVHMSIISEHLGLRTSKSSMQQFDASDLPASSYDYHPTRESALPLGHFRGAPIDTGSGWSPSSSSNFDSDAFTNTAEPNSPLTPTEDVQWSDSAIGLDEHFEADHAGGSPGSFAGQASSPVDNCQPGGYDQHTACYRMPLAKETLPRHSDESIAPISVFNPSCLPPCYGTERGAEFSRAPEPEIASATTRPATSEAHRVREAFRREVEQRAALNAPAKPKERQQKPPPVTTPAATTPAATTPTGDPRAGQIREQFRRSVAEVAATTPASRRSSNNTNGGGYNDPQSHSTHTAAAPREENHALLRSRDIIKQFKDMVWKKKKMAGIGT
ncbi:hypothetical protein B0T26DRAFT_677196 [Lasiosphaeria miniovina]|uniref:Fungal N-terminal domain-containing protein n=1 Tax=Lasiosphaeria miniovina TaxID=1954250 RepID=A0AA40ABF0_9PEZI|nr:uncharacterized protein B0T26DRAFT_677196 [Lasiosphaeria miniovina]KAK0712778.1 hypothetical protein B0T26DRAFT_677196 [Lasiosphaeria miniovina]